MIVYIIYKVQSERLMDSDISQDQIIIEMSTSMTQSAFREVPIPEGFREYVRKTLNDSSPMFIHLKVAEAGSYSHNNRIYEMDSVIAIRDAIMDRVEGAAGHPSDNRVSGYQETVMRWLNVELDENTGELFGVAYIYPHAKAIRASCATAKALNGKIATSILGRGTIDEENRVRNLKVERIDMVEPSLAGIPTMAVVPHITEALSKDQMRVGRDVQWGSSGGTAYGRIERIVRSGTLNVPDADVTLNADDDNPALLIRVYRKTEGGFQRTDTLVGHRAESVNPHEAFNVVDQEAKSKKYEDKKMSENVEKTQDILEMEKRVLELEQIQEKYNTLNKRVNVVMDMLGIDDSSKLASHVQGLQIEVRSMADENKELLESNVLSTVSGSLPEGSEEIANVLVSSVWTHEPTTRLEVENAWNTVKESDFGQRLIKIALAQSVGPPVVSENKTLEEKQAETSEEETDFAESSLIFLA